MKIHLVGNAVTILRSDLSYITVTKKHSAPFLPCTPTGRGNFFRKTILFSSHLWGVVTSGLRKVSSTIFQMLVSQVERKQLFPCSPGYMWFALICSFTLLSVHVISCMQLPVDDAISLQLSLKIPNMLFFPTVKLSFKLSQMHQMQILPTSQWSNQSEAVYLTVAHTPQISYLHFVYFLSLPC